MEVEPGVIMAIERYEIAENKGIDFRSKNSTNKTFTSRVWLLKPFHWDSAYNWKITDYLKRDFNGMRESIFSGVNLDTGH